MFSRRPRSSATFPTANRRSASAKSRSTSSAEAYRCFGSALKKLITSAGASLSSAVCTRSSRVAGYSSCARCHPGLRFGSSPIPLAMSESYSARSRMARSSMLRRGRRSVTLLPGGSADHPPPLFAYPVEFFSTAAEPPDDALLSRITHACAELGRVIEEKPAQEMLRKAERGYRDLFESVSEALIVVDPRTGTIEDANPRACDLYGVPRERMLGISVHGLWSDAGVARAALARGRRFETVLHRA